MRARLVAATRVTLVGKRRNRRKTPIVWGDSVDIRVDQQ